MSKELLYRSLAPCQKRSGLPSRTRRLFIVGGVVFVAEAISMEMIRGKYWSEQGWAIDGLDKIDVRYALIITVEELLEMFGIVIFALSEYYLQRTGMRTFTVTVADP